MVVDPYCLLGVTIGLAAFIGWCTADSLIDC